MKNAQQIKIYLHSLRFYLLLALFLFFFGVFLGWEGSKIDPQASQEVLKELEKMIEPIATTNSFWQFFYVFLNNSFTAFLVIIAGSIFGIFPVLSLFSNGEILGIMAFLSRGSLSFKTFIAGILPHGIIEIPVLIITGAIGMKIGKIAIDKFFFKKKIGIQEEMAIALDFFLRVLFPLLFLAAAIEIFVTPKVIGLF